jgi:hypothetical protein
MGQDFSRQNGWSICHGQPQRRCMGVTRHGLPGTRMANEMHRKEIKRRSGAMRAAIDTVNTVGDQQTKNQAHRHLLHQVRCRPYFRLFLQTDQQWVQRGKQEVDQNPSSR